ncbi:MAG: leucine-rich repeat protein [Prevotella sp.]|nr:leucine-rich repeat protein [Prevotella sp.]
MKTKLSDNGFPKIGNLLRTCLLVFLLALPSMVKAEIVTNVEESEVTILYSISSTGAQAFNTGYTHAANTRVVLHCNVTQDHASNWEALLGARLGSYQSNAFCFFSRTDGNDVPCFNRSGNEPRGSGFVYGEPIMVECQGQTASWYRCDDLGTPVGSVTTTGTADAGKTPMLLFNLNTSSTEGGVTMDTSPSVMTLYACNIFEGDTHVCEFVPAEYNGVVGLYDRKRKTFSGSITDTPFVGTSATKYAINLNAGDGGKLVTNLTQARPGTTVGLWQFAAVGYALESLSIKDGNGQDVSYTTTAATSVELLTNGTCDGTYNGWTKTNSGDGWDTASDYYGRDWWESSYGVCTLSQTVTLADYGLTDTEVDNGGISATASAYYLEGFNKSEAGARVCTVKVYMLDGSGNTLSTATVVDNDLTYSSAWKSGSTTFELVTGTRQLKYEVQGQDAVNWGGQYGPGFRNLSLKLQREMDAITFEMPESDVTIMATYREPNPLYYNYDTDNLTAEVTYKDEDYNSYAGDIVIPSTVKHLGTTYTVTSIGKYAFRGSSELTSVTIPSSVTSLGYHAFYDCSNLASVNIPDGVTSIGEGAFRSCSSLTSVTIPEGVEGLPMNAFYGCSSLTSVTIPESVVIIGTSAFQNCYGLTSVTIPKDVFSLGLLVFSGCSSLQTVFCHMTTPIKIDENVFDSGTYTRATLYVPTGTKSAYQATNYWSNFTNILEVAASGTCGDNLTWKYYDDGTLEILGTGAMTDYASATDAPWNNYKSSITKVVVAEGATTIGNYAFSNCSVLTSVTMPSTLTTLGYHAFSKCVQLLSVVVPEGVTKLNYSSFYKCTSMTSVSLPSTLTDMAWESFRECTSLTSVDIPAAIATIGGSTFYGCTALSSVTLHEGLVTIGRHAFENCTALTEITIPSTVKELGYISYNESACFGGCTSLATVNVSEGVEFIGPQTFKNCSALTSFTIPSTVTTIGEEAFVYCTKLSNVTIPEGVPSIGVGAFSYCSSLTSATIPESVTSIENYTFYHCTNLSNVTIPEGVTSIGYEAFCNCTSLTSITIPSSVTSMGSLPFSGCSSLTTVTIREGAECLGHYTFKNCTSLTSITIPSSITSIGENVFNGCSSLQEVYCQMTTPIEINENTFDSDTYTSATLYVPTDTKSAYESTNYWNKFTNIVEYLPTETPVITYVTTDDSCIITATGEGMVKLYANGVEVDNPYTVARTSQDQTITMTATAQEEGKDISDTATLLVTIQKIDKIEECAEVDGIYYKFFLRTQTAEVAYDELNNRDYTGDIVVPETVTYNGVVYTVTGIGNNAFSYLQKMTSLTIPNTVTTIGARAFYECSLPQVTVPSGLTSIGWQAFAYSDLTSFTIPNSVTSMGNAVFANCYDLTNVTFGSGLTTIPDSTCHFCNELVAAAIPDGVTRIGVYAFYNCQKLADLTLSKNLTSIGYKAFTACNPLSSLVIPSTVTTIEDYAFYCCSNLKTVEIQDAAVSIGVSAFEDCYTENLSLGNNVITIGERAFLSNKLKKLTLPSSLTSIGERAFEGTAFERIISKITTPFEIGQGVLGITNQAILYVPAGTKTAYENTNYWNVFKEIVEGDIIEQENADGVDICYVLHPDNLTATVTSKNDGLYAGSINIPETVTVDGVSYRVTEIGESAFVNCTDLTSVSIPNSITTIGNYLFYGCSSLTSVTIPESVTSFGEGAFSGCSSLTSVTIPEGVTSISKGLFKNCSSLTSVTIPVSATSIGEEAFLGCSNLTTVNIPENVTSIGSWAFDSSNLSSVTIPASVTTIGSNPFYGCNNLTSIIVESGNTVYDSRNNCNAIIETEPNTMISACINTTFPDDVTSIGYCAFAGLSNLTNIVIPESVTSIGEAAFAECTGLTSIGLPSGLTTLSMQLFQSCHSLYSVIIPEGVTSIGNYAFCDCIYLSEITIPESVTTIGDGAFYACINLSEITIPESVTTIGDVAFYDCINLSEITIPSSVTSIGMYCFFNCQGLKEVYSKISTPFAIDEYAFEGAWTNATLYVPMGTKAAYEATNYWNKFTNIVEVFTGRVLIDGLYYNLDGYTHTAEVSPIEEGEDQYTGDIVIPETVTYNNVEYTVTTIGESAFSGCSNLTSVSLPSTITTIGGNAFAYCTSLTDITIPEGVTTVGEFAFWNCTALTSVSLPSTLTVIGQAMFQECTGLTSITIPEGVTTISNSAFSGCSSLTSITLPSTVTFIENGAFQGCTSLTSLTCLATTPPGCETYTLYPFTQTPMSACVLKVPTGSKVAYQADTYWKVFTHIEEVSVAPTGDINGDGSVTIADVTALVNIILGKDTGSQSTQAADINGDGSVTIADVTALVNIILGKQ